MGLLLCHWRWHYSSPAKSSFVRSTLNCPTLSVVSEGRGPQRGDIDNNLVHPHPNKFDSVVLI